MTSVTRTDSGSSVMLLGASWVSDPGGRPWGPVSSYYSWKASLGRGIIEYLLRCQYFVGVNFSYVAISECSSTKFFQLSGNVPFLMCSTLENI